MVSVVASTRGIYGIARVSPVGNFNEWFEKEYQRTIAELASVKAENARLLKALDAARQSFVTIQAYPDVEDEMDEFHQIAGMIQQAEFGAEQAALAAASDGSGEGEG